MVKRRRRTSIKRYRWRTVTYANHMTQRVWIARHLAFIIARHRKEGATARERVVTITR